jgi:hypothetical protein
MLCDRPMSDITNGEIVCRWCAQAEDDPDPGDCEDGGVHTLALVNPLSVEDIDGGVAIAMRCTKCDRRGEAAIDAYLDVTWEER